MNHFNFVENTHVFDKIILKSYFWLKLSRLFNNFVRLIKMIEQNKIQELIGVLIKHAIHGEEEVVGYEYGKKVEAWFDKEMHCIDCRIQIYENSDPNNKGKLLPGTLRYFLNSLIPVDKLGNEIN